MLVATAKSSAWIVPCRAAVIAGLAVATTPAVAQSAADTTRRDAAPARIVMPYRNTPDLAGLSNVLVAFRSACLKQGWSDDLPGRLVPEGYRVVTRDVYWWGKDEGALPRAAILSRTGREDGDKAEGAPVVDMMLPNDKLPGGSCAVTWTHGWSVADAAKRRDAIVELAALTPIQIAYVLQAVPLSRPDEGFRIDDRQSEVMTWATGCFKSRCVIRTSWQYGPDGLDVSVSRMEGAADTSPRSQP